jgi:aspartate carbamoyltransferase catalytic subunit
MRHLLSAADLSRAQAIRILDTADRLGSFADRSVKKFPDPAWQRPLVDSFFEDSTSDEDLLRDGRAAAERRRHQLRGAGFPRA